MIGLLQRVSSAQVTSAGAILGTIGRGLLVFVGVARQDQEAHAERLLRRILDYRVFADAHGKMNLSLKDINGDLLLVPQFTLVADTSTGLRPSFTPAATPELGRRLYEYLVARAHARHVRVASGVFGADMQVSLVNDGPVTFWLQG